jgi:hypothetical protein
MLSSTASGVELSQADAALGVEFAPLTVAGLGHNVFFCARTPSSSAARRWAPIASRPSRVYTRQNWKRSEEPSGAVECTRRDAVSMKRLKSHSFGSRIIPVLIKCHGSQDRYVDKGS